MAASLTHDFVAQRFTGSGRALGPITAAKLKRSALAYAALCALRLAPTLLGLSPGVQENRARRTGRREIGPREHWQKQKRGDDMEIKKKIIIVEDNDLYRAALADLINSQEQMEVVAETDSGAEAVNIVCQFPADLIVLDLRPSGNKRLRYHS